MDPRLGGVVLVLLLIGAYALYGIFCPTRLLEQELDEGPPFLPYWMRYLALYDSEKKVRAACGLYLAIAIVGLVAVFVRD